MTPLDQIRSLVPKLNAGDRRKLAMLLGKFPGIDGAKPSKEVRLEADWLFQGLIGELRRRGQPSHVGSITVLRGLAPNYELASQEIRSHLERQIATDRPPPRTELNALGLIIGRSLAMHIEGRMPVALRPMLLNVGSSIEALESTFPGYIAAGMLTLLVGRREVSEK